MDSRMPLTLEANPTPRRSVRADRGWVARVRLSTGDCLYLGATSLFWIGGRDPEIGYYVGYWDKHPSAAVDDALHKWVPGASRAEALEAVGLLRAFAGLIEPPPRGQKGG